MASAYWKFPLPPPEKKKYAVLLTTGSMNPVHKGHIDMLRQAKVELERGGGHVCAAFLSPSHDLYVQSKQNGYNFVSATHRIAMANLAVQDYPWLHISSWESSQKGYWPDFPDVIEALKQNLVDRAITAHTFYVCGSDHARYCLDIDGLVVVGRTQDHGLDHAPHRHHYCIEAESNPYSACSSTTIRQLLMVQNEQAQHNAQSLLGSDVYKYIKMHQLYRS